MALQMQRPRLRLDGSMDLHNPLTIGEYLCSKCDYLVDPRIRHCTGSHIEENEGRLYHLCLNPVKKHWAGWSSGVQNDPDPALNFLQLLQLFATDTPPTPSDMPRFSPSKASFPSTPSRSRQNESYTAPSPTPSFPGTGQVLTLPSISPEDPKKCSGPLCAVKRHVSHRNQKNKSCPRKFCKLCCQNTNSPCNLHKEKGGSTGSGTAVEIINNVSATGQGSQLAIPYDRSKPLTLEHYEARKRAQQTSRQTADCCAEQTGLAQKAGKQICLIYWATNVGPSDVYQIDCDLFPHFALDKYPHILEQMLLKDAPFVETYDVDLHRWVKHQIPKMRMVKEGQTLLYRVCGITDGVDMDKEIEQVLQFHAPVTRGMKRPANFDPSESEPKPKRFALTPARATPAKTQNQIVLDGDIDVDFPLVKTVILKPKSRAPAVVEPFVVSDDDEAVEIVEASSNHGPRPLKHVTDMAAGFEAMDSAKGNNASKFLAAFPMVRKFPKTRYHDLRKTWNIAPAELKERFIKAGRTKHGLWKEFLKLVDVKSKGKDTPSIKAGKATIKATATVVKVEQSLPAAPSNMTKQPACSYCHESLPREPSESLNNLWATLLTKERKSQAPSYRWPAPPDIDFSILGARVESLADSLEAVIDDPSASVFYGALSKQIEKFGPAQAFSQQGDMDALEAGLGHFGYYGERGATIMNMALQWMFPQSDDPDAMCNDDIPFQVILWRILLPETAVILVQQDMSVDADAAMKVLRTSGRYGQVIYPSDDNCPFEEDYGRRLAHRRRPAARATNFPVKVEEVPVPFTGFRVMQQEGKEVIELDDD
ncbi:hypothetical protein C8J56DRAFT_893780 [Mycena floridula]|nr:hypothetical protein C8J56DRAFT_893780 [Mycena floridula]